MRSQPYVVRTAVLAVLALLGTMMAAASPATATVAGRAPERAPAALPVPDSFLPPLLDALRPHAQAVGLGAMLDGSEPTPDNWRSRLEPVLDEIPALFGSQTADATLQGVVVTGVLRLPATVTLTGDTTIVARSVVSDAGLVKIVAAGHAIHLYPIDGVLLGGSDPTLVIDSAPVLTEESNPDGEDGADGENGRDGESGMHGQDGWGDNCDGTSGGQGSPGEDGSDGQPGGYGQAGGSAGRIDVDVPLGDVTRYRLLADGRDGGDGGQGGSGGSGGGGGSGGDGGNADIDYAWYCVGGDGGDGAEGGNGGNAANGGSGGNGGNGGDITATLAVGIDDPAALETSSRYGNGGTHGNAGSLGFGSGGGSGGMGGFGTLHDGNDGFDGLDGFDGDSASDGDDGAAGDPGTVTIAPKCLDTKATGNVEEKRLTKKVGSQKEPAASQILRTSNFYPLVTAFETALCGSTDVAGAEAAVVASGTGLWTTATQRAQQGVAGGDDRALYWARLSMSLTLRQWRPAFAVDQATRDRLFKKLEETSRGITSIAFAPPSGTKRLLVTGFDPFDLGGDVRRSNPSGAAALALDGTTRMVGTTPVTVQAIVFPVRYADFNDKIVEDALRPFLAPGEVDAVTSTSQGSAGTFHLEVWNGRRRSADPFKDNMDKTSGGTTTSPVVAPRMGTGAEFISHSLPHQKMITAANGKPDPVVSRPSVIEIPSGGGAPVFRPTGPTAGSTAVEGSGGGFLSNEVAYRVTRLRLELNSTTPAGHVHVAAMPLPGGDAITDATFEARRAAIVAQVILVVPPAAVP
jgi:hypothetical protein